MAVGWQKGVMDEPTALERAINLIIENATAAIWAIGAVLVFVVNYALWFKVGQDRRSTIIPLFSPPSRMSPAACRYVWRMGHDDRGLTTAIVNLAVKGALTIEEDEDEEFTLHETGTKPDDLSPGEAELFRRLMENTGGSIALIEENQKTLEYAKTGLQKTLKKEWGSGLVKRNLAYTAPGYILYGLTAIAAALALDRADAMGLAFIAAWAIFPTVIATRLINKANQSRAGVAMLMVLLVPAAFLTAAAVVITEMAGPVTAAFLITAVLTQATFSQLMRAPTQAGRKVLDQIDGFRLYLKTAETERLAALHPPDQTPELFEKYLPYALALDAEDGWAGKFRDVIASAMAQGAVRRFGIPVTATASIRYGSAAASAEASKALYPRPPPRRAHPVACRAAAFPAAAPAAVAPPAAAVEAAVEAVGRVP